MDLGGIFNDFYPTSSRLKLFWDKKYQNTTDKATGRGFSTPQAPAAHAWLHAPGASATSPCRPPDGLKTTRNHGAKPHPNLHSHHQAVSAFDRRPNNWHLAIKATAASLLCNLCNFGGELLRQSFKAHKKVQFGGLQPLHNFGERQR